jgi:ketosteroid isomerase-like protein
LLYETAEVMDNPAMRFSLCLMALFLQTAHPPHRSMPAIQDECFIRDLRDKNVDDILTLYTADAIFIDPDGQEYSGSTLRKIYEQVTAAFDSDLQLKTLGFSRSNDVVIEHGTYTETLRDRAAGKVEYIHGTYLFTAQVQSDGHWLFTRMVWTLDRLK